MRKIAVFIDAGYFWVQAVHVIHACKKPRDAVVIDYSVLRQEVLTQVSSQFPNHDLLRVYWYDGPGASGKTDSHLAIEELDDFKLRLGTRNGAGNQKAVDGLIITDMISLAQSRSITNSLLVSGDADLAPGVIAAQGLGIRVHLLSMGTTAATSHILRAEADFKTHWDDAIVKKFASPSNPSKAVTTAPAPDTVVAPSSILPPELPEPAVSSSLETATSHAPDTTIFAEIAIEAHAQLLPSQTGQLSTVGPLPHVVDSLLLRIGRIKLRKQELADEERRLIRAEFKRRITPATGNST